jgi:hypothetical protein
MDDGGESSDQVSDWPEGEAASDLALEAVSRFESKTADGRLGDEPDADRLLPDRLCQALVEILPVDGAAISVYLGAEVAVPIGASDLSATTGEALQFTLSEGPCFEAYASKQPVLLPDINRPDSPAWSSWPIYTAQLTRLTPYRGLFAYPLVLADQAMGSVSFYRRSAGEPGQLVGAGDIAARITDRLLKAQTFPDPDGLVQHHWLDSPTSARRRQVWLAQGMTVQANSLTPGQALALLRAMAFAGDTLLDDVAADVVAGRIPVPTLDSKI